jgi:predicted RNA methylase
MRPSRDPDTEAEFSVLTTRLGQELLAEAAMVARPGPADLARWRQRATARQVAAAVRLAQCRRRGAAKFSRADQMWLEPVGLEQATAEAVALHKARRFEEARLVVDLCCGVGADALALGGSADRVLAVDKDLGMTRRARWNAEVYGVSPRVLVARAHAERLAIPRESWVHVDPDRRARGPNRAQTLRHYVPDLTFLKALCRTARGGALKLGPASDFEAHFGPDMEIELVSLGGECKEATIWFGDRATCRRRATRLPSGATWTDRHGFETARTRAMALSSWIYDPDPSLIRSGLLDSFAAAYGLGRIAADLDLLTGSEGADSPFLTAFEILEVWPLDRKRLRRLVRDHGLGPLEIKTRGLDWRPEDLRAWLRPEGSTPGTLLLLGGRGPARAILARRR